MDAIAAFRRAVHRGPDRTFVFDAERSITYAEADLRSEAVATALVEAGLEAGDTLGWHSFDQSLLKAYKAELITMQGPWRNVDDVELATLGWVHWWNNQRLLAPIGNIPPVEYEHHWTTTQHTEQAVNHDANDGVLT